MVRRHLLLLVVAALVVGFAAPAGAATDPARSRQWNLDRIGAEAAWSRGDGSGVTVAVIDSGVDLAHEDLAGRLVAGRDFVDDDDEPQDANGHGTHVAGIIAAARGNGRGIVGVAPGARIMPLRVLDATGSGLVEDVVAAVRWAIEHDADVVNLSLGEDTQALFGSSLADVLQEAWDAGVVPVVSAGNQFIVGSGFSDEPALVVAATTRDDRKPGYSSGVGQARWGLSAPGGEPPDRGEENAVLSTYWVAGATNQYAYLAGTSQAAPHVAGAVALLLSTGRFGPEEAVERLLATAADVGAAGRDRTFGAGRVDLAAALDGITAAPSPAPAPAPSRPPPSARPTTPTSTTTSTPTASTIEVRPLEELAAPPTTTSITVVEVPETTEAQGERSSLVAAGSEPPADDDTTAAATVAAVVLAAVAVATLRRLRLG